MRLHTVYHVESPDLFEGSCIPQAIRIDTLSLAEISQRLISGRVIISGLDQYSLDSVAKELDREIVTYVVDDIIRRDNKAECYENARLAGMNANPYFDTEFTDRCK